MHWSRVPAAVLSHVPRRLVMLSCALVAVLATASAARADVGSTATGSSVDTNPAGRAQTYRVNATATGKVDRLSVYLDRSSTASRVALGLYSAQNAQLGTCTVSAPQAGAWNRCSFSGANVTSGATYWLAVLQPTGTSGTIQYRSTTGTGHTYGSSSSSLSALPATWSNGPDWGQQTASLYADTASVAVDNPAKAVWTAPQSVRTGQSVTLDGTASTGDAPISCVWSFENEDGSTIWERISGCRITKAFNVADTKYVKLIVTDADGDTNSLEHSFPVTAGASPTPTPTPSPTPSPTPTPTPTPTPGGGGCSVNATTSNFASVFASAQPGATVCLAAGSYGTWSGGSKSGTVTVRGADGGGSRMALSFGSANNVNVQDMTITGGQINGSSRNITVGNSTFTGLFLIETSSANANIVFDGNRHVDLDAPTSGLPARVTVWSQGRPSGVTVKNSLFEGGDADGVRPDADQVQVLGNEFADIVDKGGNHADPIQLYGGTRAVIRGNYFHNANGNASAYIMQADGGTGNVIENNVFAAGQGIGYGITLLSDNGTVIRHNTFQPGTCDFNIPCGTLSLGNKSGAPVSRGTVIQDNILAMVGGGTGTYTSDHNLYTSTSAGGTGDVKGMPSFVGPLSSWAGFKLTSTSAGRTSASDGGPVGIE
jgi:Right handed beta helix region/PKD domain